MSVNGNGPGVAPIWGVVVALMLIMFVLLIAALVWAAVAAIEWQAVLRFIAPTAFETRPVEKILERGWR